MRSFEEWKKIHDSGELSAFNGGDSSGLLWLKIKSILRKESLEKFFSQSAISMQEKNLSKQFAKLYMTLASDKKLADSLDCFIRDESQRELEQLNTRKLVSELYKLKNFDWGGDYKNSLDKFLVSRYVKSIQSYTKLLSKFDSEINIAVQGYVLNSWYNHWSSIVLERVFWSHQSVVPAIGKIKNIDFFLCDIPFDLKVTYLPEGYIKEKRKEKNWDVELTFLKREARKLGIIFDKSGNNSGIYYEITEKLRDRGNAQCKKVLSTIKEQRLQILSEAKNTPQQLALWLYENQGEMRFASENRLFLVLVDSNNFDQSWKLKRNIDLIKPTINQYLDNFSQKNFEQLEMSFTYNQKSYKVLSDVIFVTR